MHIQIALKLILYFNFIMKFIVSSSNIPIKFAYDNKEVSLSEISPIGYKVGIYKVIVSNKNKEAGTSYILEATTDRRSQSLFHINETTAEIDTKHLLNRELIDVHYFKITATMNYGLS